MSSNETCVIDGVTWVKLWDAKYNRHYYYNKETKKSVWKLPPPSSSSTIELTNNLHSQSQSNATVAPTASSITEPSVTAAASAASSPWVEKMDEARGRAYYYNKATKKSQWNKPEDFVNTASAPSKPPSSTPASSSIPSNLQPLPSQSPATTSAAMAVIAVDGGTTNNTSTSSASHSTPYVSSPLWVEMVDKNSGRTFYFNKQEKKSYWTKPADFSSGSVPSPTESSPSTSSNRLLWVVKKDPKSGKNFYYNRKTMASTWIAPDNLKEEYTPPAAAVSGEGGAPPASTEKGKDKDKDASLKTLSESLATLRRLSASIESADVKLETTFSEPAVVASAVTSISGNGTVSNAVNTSPPPISTDLTPASAAIGGEPEAFDFGFNPLLAAMAKGTEKKKKPKSRDSSATSSPVKTKSDKASNKTDESKESDSVSSPKVSNAIQRMDVANAENRPTTKAKGGKASDLKGSSGSIETLPKSTESQGPLNNVVGTSVTAASRPESKATSEGDAPLKVLGTIRNKRFVSSGGTAYEIDYRFKFKLNIPPVPRYVNITREYPSMEMDGLRREGSSMQYTPPPSRLAASVSAGDAKGTGNQETTTPQAPAVPLENDASHSGWLWKKGSGTSVLGRHSWKRRWFEISGNTIKYYKKEKMTSLADVSNAVKGDLSLGVIELQGCQILELENPGHPFYFEIRPPLGDSDTGGNRTFYMKAESREAMDKWVSVMWSASSKRKSSLIK